MVFRGVKDLVVPGHLYPVSICLLNHNQHHTEIIDVPGEEVHKSLT
jgi:hypothetical protein